MRSAALRKIPSVDILFNQEESLKLAAEYGRESLVKALRDVLEAFRKEILDEGRPEPAENEFLPGNLIARAGIFLRHKLSPSITHAVNATGIIMHSGLGRAVLSEEARTALQDVTKSYCTLALDLDQGRRAQRDIHVAALLRELTGAEAATIVNNNAAATVLILNTLAAGREVVLSRGQLVEIGGSFRMPDVMKTSGAVLREVGTTNKTHLRDYEEAIGPQTGAILRVHHSNYRILGFAEEPGIDELVTLGRKHGIPVIDDLGSGALVDLKEFGLETEPLVRKSIEAGVDAACFSGDKLIGGPQSGIIVGKADWVARIKKNPLARAFRCGKLTLAAMEATLKLFLDPEKLKKRHPVYRMFSLDIKNIEKRASRVLRKVEKSAGSGIDLNVEDGESQVGSGSVPVESLPTKLLAVKSVVLSSEAIVKRLRKYRPPVFARVQSDEVLLDFRTIQADEDDIVADALMSLLKG